MITPIRSKVEDEIAGLDLGEMGVLAYPEFTHQEVVISTSYETKT